MYKQANAYDDYYAKVKAGDYNFSNKQKVITGAGAAIGGIGMGLLSNHTINKQIKNAQKRQETAKTDASRLRWEKVEDDLRKGKRKTIAGAVAGGAISGASIPHQFFSIKNDARKSADYRKARTAFWDDFDKQQEQWKRDRWQNQKAWDDFQNAYSDAYQRAWQNTYGKSSYSGRSYTNHTNPEDVSSWFSSVGADKDQFKTKADVHKWYKSQAKKYHPDINPNGEDMMKKVNDVYDKVKKSTFFSKLAFMLAQKNMEKQASIGAVLSQGAKLGSRLLSSNTGKAMISSAGRGAMQGAVMGAASSQPGQDGKNHWIRNGLRGAAMGAGIGATGVGVQKAIPRMPEFGAKIKDTFKSMGAAQGATVPPVQKPASTTI